MFATDSRQKPLPPTLIVLGDAERVRDDGIVFQQKFKHSPIHVEMYQDMLHVMQLFTLVDAFPIISLKRMGDFADKLFKKEKHENHPFLWIRRNRSMIPLTRPMTILEHGREIAKEHGFWSDQKESVYRGLVLPLIKKEKKHQSSKMSFGEWF